MTKDMYDLLEEAKGAADLALPKMTMFKVGAAVRTKGGATYTGANIESIISGLGICAERVAIAQALMNRDPRNQRYRDSSDAIIGIAVHFSKEAKGVAVDLSGDAKGVPCGACLQWIAEFAAPDCWIVSNKLGDKVLSLNELLPLRFPDLPSA